MGPDLSYHRIVYPDRVSMISQVWLLSTVTPDSVLDILDILEIYRFSIHYFERIFVFLSSNAAKCMSCEHKFRELV